MKFSFNHKKHCFSFNIPLIITLTLLIFSCTRTQPIDQPGIQQDAPAAAAAFSQKTPPLQWFQLTQAQLVPIKTASDAVSVPFKPWTEAVRVSSSLHRAGIGYLLANKTGIITADGKYEAQLITDSSCFSGSTSQSLVLFDNNILFHTYRNSFFSETPAMTESPCIVRFEDKLKLFYPIYTKKDFGFDQNTEINDVFFDGLQWYFSIKTSLADKTGFAYSCMQSDSSALTVTSQQKRSRISIESITPAKFRAAMSPKSFSSAPSQLKILFERVSEEIPAAITVRDYSAGTNISAETVFFRGENTNEENSLLCSALIEESYSAALFSDGTFLFSGALPNRTTVKNGSSAAFRLPKLPAGMQYTYFVISGGLLYAAWEETDFYQTGRTGLLIVDLPSLLY